MDYIRLTQVFRNLALQAGDAIMEIYSNGNIEIEKKSDASPVTNADKAFERFIRKEISNKFPSHQIKGEEFGEKKTKSDFTWVIDPIDGTRSFVIGNPTWSNLISLNYRGYPVLGLANFPILKKYYFNTSAKSAFVVENNKRKKIKVNNKASFSKVKLSQLNSPKSDLSPVMNLVDNLLLLLLMTTALTLPLK